MTGVAPNQITTVTVTAANSLQVGQAVDHRRHHLRLQRRLERGDRERHAVHLSGERGTLSTITLSGKATPEPRLPCRAANGADTNSNPCGGVLHARNRRGGNDNVMYITDNNGFANGTIAMVARQRVMGTQHHRRTDKLDDILPGSPAPPMGPATSRSTRPSATAATATPAPATSSRSTPAAQRRRPQLYRDHHRRGGLRHTLGTSTTTNGCSRIAVFTVAVPVTNVVVNSDYIPICRERFRYDGDTHLGRQQWFHRRQFHHRRRVHRCGRRR